MHRHTDTRTVHSVAAASEWCVAAEWSVIRWCIEFFKTTNYLTHIYMYVKMITSNLLLDRFQWANKSAVSLANINSITTARVRFQIGRLLVSDCNWSFFNQFPSLIIIDFFSGTEAIFIIFQLQMQQLTYWRPQFAPS